jgi:hypothetical protein
MVPGAGRELTGAVSLEPEPSYRLGDGDGHEVAVYPDAVAFRFREDEFRIPRERLVSVMNQASKEEWEPDVIVVVFRTYEGPLAHIVWRLVKKGRSREVSDAIYRIIDRGFLKAFRGFFYTLTHRIDTPKES